MQDIVGNVQRDIGMNGNKIPVSPLGTNTCFPLQNSLPWNLLCVCVCVCACACACMWQKLGFELRASSLQCRHSTTWSTFPIYFFLVIMEMGDCKLFVQAGLQPWSSWSQPPKFLGLQEWATCALATNNMLWCFFYLQLICAFIFYIIFLFFFFGSTGVWTRDLTITTWAMPPTLFALAILKRGSHTFPWG
jgi:hypothetical protein